MKSINDEYISSLRFKDKDEFVDAVSYRIARSLVKTNMKLDDMIRIEFGNIGLRAYLFGTNESIRTGLTDKGFFITSSFKEIEDLPKNK